VRATPPDLEADIRITTAAAGSRPVSTEGRSAPAGMAEGAEPGLTPAHGIGAALARPGGSTTVPAGTAEGATYVTPAMMTGATRLTPIAATTCPVSIVRSSTAAVSQSAS